MKRTNMVVMLICIAALFLVGCTQPPEDIAKAQVVEDSLVAEPNVVGDGDEIAVEDSMIEVSIKSIDPTQSTFEFEGYAVGKSHIGTFDVASGTLSFDGDILVGATGTIDASSVNTGIGGLDSHLIKDDFFDVAQYPTIEMSSTTVSYDPLTGEGTVTGDLTFIGVTKTISFPITVIENGLETDFLLDTTDFGIKYTGVNKDVRIAFRLVAE